MGRMLSTEIQNDQHLRSDVLTLAGGFFVPGKEVSVVLNDLGEVRILMDKFHTKEKGYETQTVSTHFRFARFESDPGAKRTRVHSSPTAAAAAGAHF